VIATGRIMQTVIPGSSQSNRDRADLVALRRLGTVEDCAKVVEFLATDLSDYVTGAVIPIDGGLVRWISHGIETRERVGIISIASGGILCCQFGSRDRAPSSFRTGRYARPY
jgi:hypothetical protein